MEEMNFLILGVGGQGTILAGDVVSEAGMLAGYEVKKSDILGLAIRSGSVTSFIRWGNHVFSPVAPKGSIDYLLAFEPLESLRMLEYLKPSATIILNEYKIPPVAVSTGQMVYPSQEEILGYLEQNSSRLIRTNATIKSQELGSVKVLNIYMVGILASLLPLDTTIWTQAIRKFAPPKFLELNLKAFEKGYLETTPQHAPM